MKLTAVTIHLIRRGTKAQQVEPLLSEAISPISEPIRLFLEDSFLRFLPRSRRIVRSDDTSSATPAEITSYFRGEADLLTLSVSLAKRLQALQSGSYSDGLLLVAEGEEDGRPSVFIVKLENEQGVRARQTTDSEGRLIFDVELLGDLFMTKNTQVYKIAIFDDRCADELAFAGHLVDRQVQGYNVAAYFLFDFLGCQYAIRADVLTHNFHDAVQQVIATTPEPSEKARIQVALIGELLSNDKNLDRTSFANKHLPASLRAEFSQSLADKSVPLSWPKDNRLVENALRDVQMVFQAGSILITPPSELGELGSVTVTKEHGDQARVTIRDTLLSVGGKGRATGGNTTPGNADAA